MEVLTLTVFVSAVLVVAALWSFAWSVHQRSHEHSDRLTLLPLQDDEPTTQLDSDREGGATEPQDNAERIEAQAPKGRGHDPHHLRR